MLHDSSQIQQHLLQGLHLVKQNMDQSIAQQMVDAIIGIESEYINRKINSTAFNSRFIALAKEWVKLIN